MMTSKKFIFLILIFAPSILFAQTNETPLYEGMQKTEQQLKADQDFVAETTKLAGSKEDAAKQMITKGWDAISKQDFSTAIKRFNQAFLLNPKNYDLYWGLGMATGMSGDLASSEKMFAKGYELNKTDIRFLSDYGFALQQVAIAGAKTQNPRPKLEQAQKLFEEAIKLEPDKSLPHARLAVSYYYAANCKGAKSEVEKSQKLGADGLDPRFVEDLKKNCK